MRLRNPAIIFAVAGALQATHATAQDIDTSDGTEAACCAAAIYRNPLEFSEGWGQSFVASGVRLVSFSFYLREAFGGEDATFRATVHKWNGSAPFGAALFTSSIRQGQVGSWTESFTANIGMQQDDSYVALLNAVSLNTFIYMPIMFDDYAGGSLVNKLTFMSDPPLYFSGADFIEPYDAGFTAQFDDVVVTPEPVSVMLIGTGLAGVAAARRRRRSAAGQTDR